MADELFDKILKTVLEIKLSKPTTQQVQIPQSPLAQITTGSRTTETGPPDIHHNSNPYSGKKSVTAPTTPFGATGARTRMFEYQVPTGSNGYIDYLGFNSNAQAVKIHLIIDGNDKFGPSGVETYPGTVDNPVKVNPWWRYEVHESVIVEYENFARESFFLSCYVSVWSYALKDAEAVRLWLRG